MQKGSSNKILWIESIRSFSIIAVIAIHSIYSALLLHSNGALSITELTIYRSLMNLLWWGVPCFLMISGYLLLDPEKIISYDKVLKQYIPRILGVLLLFGTVFVWMELVFSQRMISTFQIGAALLNVFKGQSWAHLWYLYCLLGIYFLLPIYRILAKHLSDKDLIYYLLFNFIFLSVLRVTNVFGIDSGFYIHVATIYPFWFFMGLAVKRGLFQLPMQKNSVILLLSSLFLVTLTFIQYRIGISTISALFGYDSPIVLFQAITLFNILKNINIVQIKKLIYAVGNNSFGIYIVHMFFVNFFYKALHINPLKNTWGTTYYFGVN